MWRAHPPSGWSELRWWNLSTRLRGCLDSIMRAVTLLALWLRDLHDICLASDSFQSEPAAAITSSLLQCEINSCWVANSYHKLPINFNYVEQRFWVNAQSCWKFSSQVTRVFYTCLNFVILKLTHRAVKEFGLGLGEYAYRISAETEYSFSTLRPKIAHTFTHDVHNLPLSRTLSFLLLRIMIFPKKSFSYDHHIHSMSSLHSPPPDLMSRAFTPGVRKYSKYYIFYLRSIINNMVDSIWEKSAQFLAFSISWKKTFT